MAVGMDWFVSPVMMSAVIVTSHISFVVVP
jgi:hypothetical protein